MVFRFQLITMYSQDWESVLSTCASPSVVSKTEAAASLGERFMNADSQAPPQTYRVSICTLSSPSAMSAHFKFEKHGSSVAHGTQGWHSNSCNLMVTTSPLGSLQIYTHSEKLSEPLQIKFPLMREIYKHPWLF